MYGTPTKQTNLYEKISYTDVASSEKDDHEQVNDEVDNISKLIEENLDTLDSKVDS